MTSPIANPPRFGRRLGHFAPSLAVLLLLAGCASDMPVLGTATPQEPLSVPDKPPHEILDAALDDAREQVVRSAHSEDAFIRANALEAAQYLDGGVTPLLQLGLEDGHPAVRFAALTTIGRLRLEDLAGSVERVLADEEEAASQWRREVRERGERLSERRRHELATRINFSRSVQAAAYFALARCGRNVDITPMAVLLASSDPTVRGNVAMLLGYLGDESAVALLEEVALKPIRRATDHGWALTRVQIAEAILRLGDESALDTLRAAAFSQHHEVRVLAVEAMAELGDRGLEAGFEQMVLEDRNNIELRLAAARALARFGGTRGIELVYDAAEADHAIFRIWAARTLGLFDDPAAAARLVRLLSDGDERVRLTAAANILRLRG